MTNLKLDIQSKYSEGCNSLRTYSSHVMNVRTMTIVQGFVVLTASGYLIYERFFFYSLCVSGFGLLFTAVLYSLQKNYWEHFNTFLKYVIKLESSCESENISDGPWVSYDIKRRERHKKLRWRLTAVEGPFIILLITFTLIIVYDAIMLKV